MAETFKPLKFTGSLTACAAYRLGHHSCSYGTEGSPLQWTACNGINLINQFKEEGLSVLTLEYSLMGQRAGSGNS